MYSVLFTRTSIGPFAGYRVNFRLRGGNIKTDSPCASFFNCRKLGNRPTSACNDFVTSRKNASNKCLAESRRASSDSLAKLRHKAECVGSLLA
jgi:hypothetical protein